MNSNRLQYLLERKTFLGRVWDKVQNFLASAATLGLAHYAGKAISPKYDAFTTGLGKSLKDKASALTTAGAGMKVSDLNSTMEGLKAQIETLEQQGVKRSDPQIVKLINQGKELKRERDQFKTMQQENFNMNKQDTNIKQFIKQLGEKNYSEADKYLQQVVEDKLKAKIADQYKKQKLY